MLFLRSWLEDYIDLSAFSDAEVEQVLTLKSSEVDEINSITDYFGGKVVVGQIENLRKHPEADRLNIFEVNLGPDLGKTTIVSAASNCAENLLVPVALVGCQLPFFGVSVRKLRGVESSGLCLGKSELMLETEMSPGLWELESELEKKNLSPQEVLGRSICSIFPEYFPSETVLDVKVLPDRISQIGNHLGLAWDLAVSLEKMELLTEKGRLILQSPEKIKEQKKEILEQKKPEQKGEIIVDFDDQSGYTSSFNLYNLKLQKEFILPHSMQKRMFLLQKNLTGTPADLSNYLMWDMGQPSHFFSTSKVFPQV